MKAMRACIYIRVSTEEQAQEGFSLAAQEERCKQFIESQGWEFTGTYKDEGFSAKNLERPGVQEVLQAVREKEFDVLVVYRLDRLVRSVLDLHYVLDLLDQHNVMFKSTTEVFDTTTATGRLFISIIGSLAQWERENLAERVKLGMEKRVMEGKRGGGIAPYGFRYGKDRELLPYEPEAAVVRRAFELYKTKGIRQIVTIFNEEGIKNRDGNKWKVNNIYYMIQNPVYAGHLRWNYKEGTNKPNELILAENTHKPIISQEEFDEAQKTLKKRSIKRSRATTTEYPFSGVLICSRCGSGFTGRIHHYKNRTVIHYRCLGFTTTNTCNFPQIDQRAVTDAIFSKLEWFVKESDIPDLPEHSSPETMDKEQRRKEIEKEIEQIKNRRKKWQYAFANDAISLEELKELTQEDRQREEQLNKELVALPSIQSEQQPQISMEELIQHINSLEEVWPKLPMIEQRKLIHTIFKSIIIEADMNFTPLRGRYRPVNIVDFELNS